MSTDATTLRVKITGAKPNNSYSLQICLIENVCRALGTVTSDAAGVVSATVDTGQWELFSGEVILSDSAGVEYISAFRAESE